MGQYYRAIILEKDLDFDETGKEARKGAFKEGNNDDFYNFADELIGYTLYPHNYGSGAKIVEFGYIDSYFTLNIKATLDKRRLVIAGDYADEIQGQDFNLYQAFGEIIKYRGLVNHSEADYLKIKSRMEPFIYVINHSKNVYYNEQELKLHAGTLQDDEDIRDPLMLLCAEGNGRGGGDYKTEDPTIGTWARDIIEVSKDEPTTGFLKLTPGEVYFLPS